MGNRIIAGLPGLVTPAIGAFSGIVGPVGPLQGGGGFEASNEVTVTTSGNFIGAHTGAQVDPNDLNGVAFSFLRYDTANERWLIGLLADVAQSFFTSFEAETAAGPLLPVFETADAGFVPFDGTDTVWFWNTDPSNGWSAADSGNTLGVDFVLP